METYYGSMYCFAPGGTAVPAINPGNASVPGRPREHASAAEYLQRDIANSNSNLHSNWASEASPTLGCSIEISRDIYIYICACVCRMSN